MLYQKDWLMRQIESMIAAFMHFLVHTEEPHDKTCEVYQTLNEQIDDFLRNGDICEAEDWLFENLNPSDPRWLKLAIYFYYEINKFSDTYLNEHSFSREEISSGLQYVSQQYGYQDILKYC